MNSIDTDIDIDIDTDIDTDVERMEYVEEKTLDLLIDAGSIAEIHAIKNDEGKYELIAVTGNQIRIQLYTQTGKPRSFADLDRFVGWCERRGIHRVQVCTETDRDEVEPEPA